jgi:hypothetical protein
MPFEEIKRFFQREDAREQEKRRQEAIEAQQRQAAYDKQQHEDKINEKITRQYLDESKIAELIRAFADVVKSREQDVRELNIYGPSFYHIEVRTEGQIEIRGGYIEYEVKWQWRGKAVHFTVKVTNNGNILVLGDPGAGTTKLVHAQWKDKSSTIEQALTKAFFNPDIPKYYQPPYEHKPYGF